MIPDLNRRLNKLSLIWGVEAILIHKLTRIHMLVPSLLKVVAMSRTSINLRKYWSVRKKDSSISRVNSLFRRRKSSNYRLSVTTLESIVKMIPESALLQQTTWKKLTKISRRRSKRSNSSCKALSDCRAQVATTTQCCLDRVKVFHKEPMRKCTSLKREPQVATTARSKNVFKTRTAPLNPWNSLPSRQLARSAAKVKPKETLTKTITVWASQI